jgi:hypothetical protein
MPPGRVKSGVPLGVDGGGRRVAPSPGERDGTHTGCRAPGRRSGGHAPARGDIPPCRTPWRAGEAGHHGDTQRCGICPASAEKAVAEIRPAPGAPAAAAVRKTLRTAAPAHARGHQADSETCATGARLALGTPTAGATGAAGTAPAGAESVSAVWQDAPQEGRYDLMGPRMHRKGAHRHG